MIQFFDCESSGLYDFRSHCTAEHQPHIVSLASICFLDDGRCEVGVQYNIIRPEGYIIPDEAAAVHGITTELALEYGIPLKAALEFFDEHCDRADYQIAFNADFQRMIIETAYARTGREAQLQKEKVRCLRQTMTEIMQIPTERGDYKWPKLDEAYAWVFGRPMPAGAHDALLDARHTAHIAFALRDDLKYWDFNTVTAPRLPPPPPGKFGK